MSYKVPITASVLVLLGFGLILYKNVSLGFPFLPDEYKSQWQVEAHVSFIAEGGPVKVSLAIPSGESDYSLLYENFVGRGFGLSMGKKKGNRNAVWAIHRAVGQQHLYYRSVVTEYLGGSLPALNQGKYELEFSHEAEETAAKALLLDIRKQSADTESFVSQLFYKIRNHQKEDNLQALIGAQVTSSRLAKIAVKLLNKEGIDSELVHGISLESDQRNASLVEWVEVFYDDRWHSFSAFGERIRTKGRLLPWWKGENSPLEVLGAKHERVKFSISRSESQAVIQAVSKARDDHPLFMKFSLFDLPIQTQAVYKVLVMLPVGALVVVLLRNVIGIFSFGTFMPVLIAMSFRETKLLWGLILFTLVLSAGVLIRLLLERLTLLTTSRLAAVVCAVVIVMGLISNLLNIAGLSQGLSVALFPMVIITMIIERMSIIWEERGALTAIKQCIASLFVSLFVYAIISITSLRFFMFTYPESLLIVLAMIIVLGRYTGYRLLELLRFSPLADESRER